MKKINKYEVIIYWSSADDVFIAEMPGLRGCTAHGDTQDEALKEISIVAAEWLRIAEEKGRPVPQPKGRLVYA